MANWKRWLRANWDRTGAWFCVVGGAMVLLAGWKGVSRTAYPAEQMPYIVSGGIGGALLVALGATLLISADLRDEWRKLDRIERRLAAQESAADATRDLEPVGAPATPTTSSNGTAGKRVKGRRS